MSSVSNDLTPKSVQFACLPVARLRPVAVVTNVAGSVCDQQVVLCPNTQRHSVLTVTRFGFDSFFSKCCNKAVTDLSVYIQVH